jgi:hypothetical protein
MAKRNTPKKKVVKIELREANLTYNKKDGGDLKYIASNGVQGMAKFTQCSIVQLAVEDNGSSIVLKFFKTTTGNSADVAVTLVQPGQQCGCSITSDTQDRPTDVSGALE